MRFILSQVALAAGGFLLAADQNLVAGELEGGFGKPPPEARLGVYWFWLKGNLARPQANGAAALANSARAPERMIARAWRHASSVSHRQPKQKGRRLSAPAQS